MKRPDTKAIAERAEAATEGPWSWSHIGEKVNGYVVGFAMSEDEQVLEGCLETYDDMVDEIVRLSPRSHEIGDHEASTCNYGDPSFIAAARTDIPALLAWVEHLEGYIRNHGDVCPEMFAKDNAAQVLDDDE